MNQEDEPTATHDHLWTPWRMTYLQGDNTGQPEPGCIFCTKPTRQDDRAEHIVVRGQWCYVTLNKYPYNNGHLMVIPYAHVPSIEQLAPEHLAELMALAQQAVVALRRAYQPQGFNLGCNIGQVAGAGVADHVHLHIVPRWGGDTNYMTVVGQTRVIPEWLDGTYTRLREVWDPAPQAGSENK